ncbi:hypothetical protein L2Y94_10475 [Luteibacter aegosomatis]|uniref:hypothetical protein n=1 Tax=Luteibacter aegosomatis TaxID=2911537 RepID=UPI001FF8CD3A|nr:hypothetical protein [Luteibacter aegosomatis]UPG87753.1 hypothetical protein L2Y94_10475 [Luteibacter aegosomatis]
MSYSNGRPTFSLFGNDEICSVFTGELVALVGWACSSGWGPSIDVHLYVAGDASSGGTFVGAYHANVSSEAAVQQACHSSGTAHRFSIPLTDANRVQFVAQTLVVYGISP